MHPSFVELFAYLDREHDALRRTLDAVPAERRPVRPAADQWSVDDVLSHLVLVERRLAHLFAKLIAEARADGLAAESSTEPVLPRIDTRRVIDRSSRIVGPAAVDPRTDGVRFGWDDYERARAALKEALLAGDGLALGTIRYAHPALGTLDLYEWIAFAGAHAARHAAQIAEIDARLRLGTTSS